MSVLLCLLPVPKGLVAKIEKGLCNPNRVVFHTTVRACGTTIRVLMPLLFLVSSIRLMLGLGLG